MTVPAPCRNALLAALLAAACEPSGPVADGGLDAGPDAGDTDGDTGTGDGGPPAGDGGPDLLDGGFDGGDGTCLPADDLSPDAAVDGSTVGGHNNLSDYSCTALVEDGPDLAYAFTNELAGPVEVAFTLTPSSDVDLDLFLLAGECAAAACESFSAGQEVERLAAVLAPGKQVFAAVDGYQQAAGAFLLELATRPVETDCAGGVDDDGDGLTDCDDDDCAFDAACAALCDATSPVACGGSLAGTAGADGGALDAYGPEHTGCTAAEVVAALPSPGPGARVTATLAAASPALELYTLLGECSSAAVEHAGGATVDLVPPAGVEIFFVADGPAAAAGAVEIAVSCEELDCGGGIDDDGDGFTDCDDGDCALAPECVVACDPLASVASCADAGYDAACYLLEADPLLGYCAQAGDAGAGAACAASSECAPGHLCAPADVCLATCGLSDGGPECDGGACTSIGADPLGVCY
mgnify:CR=1 FL=1